MITDATTGYKQHVAYSSFVSSQPHMNTVSLAIFLFYGIINLLDSLMQTVTRCIEIDYGHRVLNERFKCFNVHGHRAKIELTFAFNIMSDLGYCIDFKEIKRIGGQWIEDHMDHAFIANPADCIMIDACRRINSKLYVLSLAGPNYCNPTAENIGRELFCAMELLFADFSGLDIATIRFYETPNCYVDTTADSISKTERTQFRQCRQTELLAYRAAKGQLEYDDRKVKQESLCE